MFPSINTLSNSKINHEQLIISNQVVLNSEQNSITDQVNMGNSRDNNLEFNNLINDQLIGNNIDEDYDNFALNSL